MAAIYFYNHFNSELTKATWHPSTSPDIRVNLYSAFTFTASHTTKTQAETGATQLPTANGYTQNAKVVSGWAMNVLATTGLTITSDAVIWYPTSGQSIEARYALFYANAVTGQKPLFVLDNGSPVSISAPLPFVVAPPESGWATLNFV